MNKQDAIGYLEDLLATCDCLNFHCGRHDEAIKMAISALEQQLSGWIPVSERLPEENGHYLVTYHEWSKGEYLPKFDFTCEKILRFYCGEFEMPVCCNDKIEQDIGREVLAWMPLPEPYREEDNDADPINLDQNRI